MTSDPTRLLLQPCYMPRHINLYSRCSITIDAGE